MPRPSPPPPLGRPSLEPLPTAGAWIFTCREGFERDLAEELLLAKRDLAPRLLAPALLAIDGPPRREGAGRAVVSGASAAGDPTVPKWAAELTFARQGFPLAAALRAPADHALADPCVHAIAPLLAPREPWTLHAWVPDSTAGNRLSSTASALEEAIARGLAAADPSLGSRRSRPGERRPGGMLAQVCLAAADVALVGAQPFGEAISPFPGGRARMHVGAAAPSRAAMKLEEALAWFGFGPEPGETCVDLGAAPGGWTWVLLERRARVIAVDPGRLAPEIAARRGVTAVRGSAFDFEPREPVDWLFCDMVWRPLEVAALLAKWGRRRWARALVANVKLPMKHKAEFLARIRRTVAGGGWRDVRTRHLYHDRDEVTLIAWRTP
jgi:23S rRNA (cytidine2498-2'-O)-methyltransferase